MEIDLRENKLEESVNEILNTLLSRPNLKSLLLRIDCLSTVQLDRLVFGVAKMPNLTRLALGLPPSTNPQRILQILSKTCPSLATQLL